jgi:hypothetical protein
VGRLAVGLDVEVGDLGSVSSRSDAVPGGRAGIAGDADLVGGVAIWMTAATGTEVKE